MVTNNNPLLAKLSGQFGGILVARQLRGKTVISKMPRKRDRSLETDAQRATYDRMRNAGRFAGEILQDPEKKVYYSAMAKRLKLPNARTAAVTDYLRNGDRRLEDTEMLELVQQIRETNEFFKKRDELNSLQNNVDGHAVSAPLTPRLSKPSYIWVPRS